MPIIKQRQQAERLRNLWMNYMSVPLVIEQFMVWLDDYLPEIIVYAIKQTARKRAMLKGNMDLDYILAYATKTMQNENVRRTQDIAHECGERTTKMNSNIFTEDNEKQFLEAIKQDKKREAAERENPYYQAAVKLLDKHENPTIEQVQEALNNL